MRPDASLEFVDRFAGDLLDFMVDYALGGALVLVVATVMSRSLRWMARR